MIKNVVLALLVLLASLPAFAADKGKESVSGRVVRTGTIRCGYAMWTPVLYQDLKSGQLAGISYELMNEIGKRLDLKIEWAEETGWGTLVEGLATDRYDMICVGLAASSGRAKVIGFSRPYFFSPLYLVARADDMRFDGGDWAMLDDPQYKIAVLDGEMSSVYVHQVLPKATAVAMPQMADYAMLLKEVETKKADVTMVTPETFAAYDKSNPGLLKIVRQDKPLSTFPCTFGLPLGDSALESMVNAALGELILDGTVERLIQKYEEFPNTFLRVFPPFIAAP